MTNTFFMILLGIGALAVLSAMYNRAIDRKTKAPPPKRPPHYFQ
jgi:hypothetical protein